MVYSYLVEQVEVLLSQFEWKSRDSPTETRLTDSLSFVTPANFPRAVTVYRRAKDVTYTVPKVGGARSKRSKVAIHHTFLRK